MMQTLLRANRRVAWSVVVRPHSTVGNEERYQLKTLREHVLLRPDTYVGSITPVTRPMWVLGAGAADDGRRRIVRREVTYVPALYKIFDEILVNAMDNRQRDPTGTTRIDVVIDVVNGQLSVRNNGRGLPIERHNAPGAEGLYVPEMLFGTLLTGSNFDDSRALTTGGRNGYGAKLTNIFSSEFVLESFDASSATHYRQRWCDNMETRHDPEITRATDRDWSPSARAAFEGSARENFTLVTFTPDLERFGMTRLDEFDVDSDERAGVLSLLGRRTYDVAGCCSRSGAPRRGKRAGESAFRVTLNADPIGVTSFGEYLDLHEGLPPIAATARLELGRADGSDRCAMGPRALSAALF